MNNNMSFDKLMVVYKKIGEAIGESLENVCNMREDERRDLITTLGLEESVRKIENGVDDTKVDHDKGNYNDVGETVNEKIAAAIGESVESVNSLPSAERKQLIKALGLEHLVKKETASSVIDVADLSSDSDDDDILVTTDPAPNNIVISDDDGDQGTSAGGSYEFTGRGWGECPVCEQLMPRDKLQLHAMACQGIEFNGGDGLEVNPMEVQSKCSMCGCLVPDLVMDEHKETCWANNSTKRRIETPMERRRSKYPKTNFWASAPRK